MDKMASTPYIKVSLFMVLPFLHDVFTFPSNVKDNAKSTNDIKVMVLVNNTKFFKIIIVLLVHEALYVNLQLKAVQIYKRKLHKKVQYILHRIKYYFFRNGHLNLFRPMLLFL